MRYSSWNEIKWVAVNSALFSGELIYFGFIKKDECVNEYVVLGLLSFVTYNTVEQTTEILAYPFVYLAKIMAGNISPGLGEFLGFATSSIVAISAHTIAFGATALVHYGVFKDISFPFCALPTAHSFAVLVVDSAVSLAALAFDTDDFA